MVVATVVLSESNGASETVTDNIANLNMGSVDSPNLNYASNPIVAGTNSYEKWLRIKLVNINNSNKIDNFQIYMTPAPSVTGVSYLTNLKTAPLNQNAYSTPTNAVSSVATLSMPTSDPGVENIGVAGGSSGLSTANSYSDYFVTQVQTTAASPPGDIPQKTIHVEYDEQ